MTSREEFERVKLQCEATIKEIDRWSAAMSECEKNYSKTLKKLILDEQLLAGTWDVSELANSAPGTVLCLIQREDHTLWNDYMSNSPCGTSVWFDGARLQVLPTHMELQVNINSLDTFVLKHDIRVDTASLHKAEESAFALHDKLLTLLHMLGD